jgi:hypothetical protein
MQSIAGIVLSVLDGNRWKRRSSLDINSFDLLIDIDRWHGLPVDHHGVMSGMHGGDIESSCVGGVERAHGHSLLFRFGC